MRFLLFVFVIALSGCIHSQSLGINTSESIQNDVVCPKRSGFLDGPFVWDEDTAKMIAQVIIDGIKKRKPDDKYVLEVFNDGSHWEVFQSIRRIDEEIEEDGAITVIAGGGGVAMRIAKCDGAVSEVHFSR